MTIREQINKKLTSLNDTELQQVAEYLSFLKYRSNLKSNSSVNVKNLARLYQEFAGEDRQLAEEGLEDYSKNLRSEDTE